MMSMTIPSRRYLDPYFIEEIREQRDLDKLMVQRVEITDFSPDLADAKSSILPAHMLLLCREILEPGILTGMWFLRSLPIPIACASINNMRA